MKPVSISLILCAAMASAFFSSAALAADITPGLWTITMETRASATPGFQPAPVTVNQCFTAADARDPSKILGGMSNPGASGCQYTEQSFSGNTFRFDGGDRQAHRLKPELAQQLARVRGVVHGGGTHVCGATQW